MAFIVLKTKSLKFKSKEVNLGMKPFKKNILVFRIGQIGDTVAALPSLWVLRRQFPDAHIVVLSELPARSTHLPPETVLPSQGLVDGFEKYPGGASVRNFFAARRQIIRLRKQGFNTLVYLVPSARTKRQRLRDRFFFRLCGIRHLLATQGFSENQKPKAPHGSLVPLKKEADALLERLRFDGLRVPTPGAGCMDLRITDAERASANHWWQQKGGAQPGPNGWVAICVGGKTSTQLWPLERYAEVGRLLIEKHGLFPVIIGGREDRKTGDELLSQWGTGLCAAGELNVRESAALMEGAQFYLGNDTGAMHLAAAVGRPCVAIFSARNWPGVWEPYGKGHKVLRFDVPCSGCHLAVCDQQLQCLTNIQVQDVYQACNEVLART
jgi:ADP-heptose:LPS heptosyltransferase